MCKLAGSCAVILIIASCAQLPTGGHRQDGRASFYGNGDGFDGCRTANGEIFKCGSLTAAHRTHPFGTLCKVTNLSNGKSVVVRINNRGPYRRGRIIDLSYAAAKQIGMIRAGVVDVRVEVLKAEKEGARQGRGRTPAYAPPGPDMDWPAAGDRVGDGQIPAGARVHRSPCRLHGDAGDASCPVTS